VSVSVSVYVSYSRHLLLSTNDIDKIGDIWIYIPESHKNEHRNKHRAIHIGPKAQAVLLPYLAKAGKGYCFHPRSKPNKPLRERDYRSAIQRACRWAFPAPEEMAGNALKDWQKANRWSPNQIRHTAGTVIRSKYGLEGAQVVLGHAKADTTQIYAERDMRLAAEIMREVG